MNQNEFPRMVYQAGGTEEIHGGRFATNIVNDQDELDAALAGGWHLTTPEAKAAAEKPDAAGAADAGAGGADDDKDDDAPPTREELKAKATQLGLTFPGNVSNAKLAEMIDAALAGGDKA
ncbi:hypothetical protein [Massilia varians]|uniref:hypothetical protein n=1 Tax=Massilia varians TaxID=457921 RepID=UPI002557497E|nr:hypothetical protein [Massilia varians]MDK6077934.1 hypothetical protein [Massilia varians]